MHARSFLLIIMSSVFLTACSRIFPERAGLQIVSNIPSSVSIDGKSVGQTPYKIDSLSSKKYEVTVTPNDTGFEAYASSVKLTGGYESLVDWNFATSKDESSGVIFAIDKAQRNGATELEIIASPDNVPVSLDGNSVGFTPLLLDDVTAGKHTITLSAPGFESLSRDIVLVKNKRLEFTAKLARKALPAPTPLPTASDSALASPSAQVKGISTAVKTTPKPTPKVPSTSKPTPTASGSATPKTTSTAVPAASSSGILQKKTTLRPYVEILTTPVGYLRVRAQASTSAAELVKLGPGSTVPYANASASGWLKVTYDASSVGWVSTQYARLIQ